MYLLYVDESGDPGIHEYSSEYYILSGLIVNQEEWSKYLNRLKLFRKHVKEKYRLNQRVEIHSKELIRIGKIKEYTEITKTNRINILKEYSNQIPVIFDTAKCINICLLKKDFMDKDIQNEAWKKLIQRFDIYLKKIGKDKGIIVSDDGDIVKISQLLRKMRIYNPTPSYFGGMYYPVADNVIEDIFSKSSHHSYFIQTVDVISHLLYRQEFPKGALKKFGLEHQFKNVEPILLKEASNHDAQGIVRK